MTAVPEAPAPARQARVAAEVPGDVYRRLRTWAALRGQPVAHVVSEVICRAVPSADQLAAQMHESGAPNDNQR